MAVFYVILFYPPGYFNGQTDKKKTQIVQYQSICEICFEFFASGCYILRVCATKIIINFISALHFSEVLRLKDV